ncbi:MAG: hypothetical protein KDA93_01555 [Planctomycetaceae bacterium]|nr:hypothetical protein [Planctomycetaceae bacterium]
MSRHESLIGKLLVPDVLRPKPIPQWQQPLEESGTRSRRFVRFLWRTYQFAQPKRSASLPGPALDLVVLLSTLIFGVAAWVV